MKLKEILFLRHGNVVRSKEKYEDDFKLHLSDLGIQQARNIKKQIARFNPDVVYSSTIPRAIQTAEIVTKDISNNILPTAELRERIFPSLFNKSFDSIIKEKSEKFVAQLKQGSENIEIPNEETLENAQYRIVTFIEKCLSTYHSKILIVSHGGPHSWYCCHLLGINLNKLRLFKLSEASFSHFVYHNKDLFRIHSLNSKML